MHAWENVFHMPVGGRTTKPRQRGVTMVIDKGLGLNATEDLMATAADYIDYLKLSFGTSAFYDEALLHQKISLVRRAGVDIYPGGTFFEVAMAQGTYEQYLARAKELGFTVIEVSDGTIEMSDRLRREVIGKALNAGFKVISEVGKKDPSEKVPMVRIHEQIQSDLAMGALKVIVEARESGRGVGIYDASGMVVESEVDEIMAGVEEVDNLIWEAPLKRQQLYLILKFRPNVNLGNVPPEDILALEALRCGLRGDTFQRTLCQESSPSS